MENKNNLQAQKHPIDYQTAQSMIKDYQNLHFGDSDYLASEYFDADVIRQLLSNPKCKGLRIYNALKSEDGKSQNRFILMAEDEHGKTILNYQIKLSAVSMNGLGVSAGFVDPVVGIAENGKPCPPYCS
jgi:hypothetical protein